MAVSKELLLKPRLPEADVDIPGVGTVRVRGLNRGEAMKVGEAEGFVATECRLIAFGMVDPQLTEDEVRQWQHSVTAGELEPVSTKIAELSGMFEGAEKEAYKSLRGEPGSGESVLPGGEVVDDSSPAPGGNEQ